MRWVVAGGRGQLGLAMQALLAQRSDLELLSARDLPELDVSDPGAVAAWLDGLEARPDVLLNAAAFTHVDRCETDPETAERVNGVAPGILAEACARLGARMIHVSTDYVFAGDASRPYREGDPPSPRSSYGRSKLAGERRVQEALPEALVVRTSWVFGEGRNFVRAILDQARKRRAGELEGPLRVVDDQRGRPTYAVDLAGGLLGLLERGATGLYHFANGGEATWWDLARAVLDEAGFGDLEVERIRTRDLDLPAPRPAWSVLDCSKAAALGIEARPWRQALADYLAS